MANTVNIRIPDNFGLENPCTGEIVNFSGVLHFIITETFDKDGGEHITNHLNTQGSQGIGATTGAHYRLIQVNNAEQNFRPPFPEEFTSVMNLKVVGTHGAPTFFIRMTVHFTRNANGDFTVNKSSFKASDCE